ncbi:hypothetical protein BN163_1130023 [Clostridioides difficile T5]|nr:hypothetical protein BN163_1130023 [Clostridioides difficile T5]
MFWTYNNSYSGMTALPHLSPFQGIKNKD